MNKDDEQNTTNERNKARQKKSKVETSRILLQNLQSSLPSSTTLQGENGSPKISTLSPFSCRSLSIRSSTALVDQPVLSTGPPWIVWPPMYVLRMFSSRVCWPKPQKRWRTPLSRPVGFIPEQQETNRPMVNETDQSVVFDKGCVPSVVEKCNGTTRKEEEKEKRWKPLTALHLNSANHVGVSSPTNGAPCLFFYFFFATWIPSRTVRVITESRPAGRVRGR